MIFYFKLLEGFIDFTVFFGNFLQIARNTFYSELAHAGVFAFSKVWGVQQLSDNGSKALFSHVCLDHYMRFGSRDVGRVTPFFL